MKYVFFVLAFMLVGPFAFSNNKIENPIINKIVIGDYEVAKNSSGRFVYKKYLDENKSSFKAFVPFFEQPALQNTTFSTQVLEDEIVLFYKEGVNETFRKFSNFSKNNDGSISFDISAKNNVIGRATISGENLNVDFVKNMMLNITDQNLLSEECPPCVVGVVAAIAWACSDARSACDGCTRGHRVSACGCSCQSYDQVS